MFLHNSWYVAAFGCEIGQEPLARTLLGEPILLYRTADGKVVALENRCCHRNLPLSMGRREGDDIRCGYHGLKFDVTGRCIEIPGQKEIPAAARVKSYPLVEKWDFVWIWTGDAAKPDLSLLPQWQCLEDRRLTRTIGNGGKPLPMRCHWELNNDNLLDLTHTVYVHPTTLGDPGPDRFPVTTERFARGVRMLRWMTDVPPVTLLAQLAGFQGNNVDRWQSTLCEMPSHCTIDAGFVPARAVGRDGDWDSGVRLRALITATPETESTSFMFYQQCRNFAVGNEEISRRFIANIRDVFLEDIAVMEGQQRINTAMPFAPRVDIRADAPVVAMRRLVQQFMAAEAVTKVEPERSAALPG